MRSIYITILSIYALLAVGELSHAQQVREKYDAFTDLTTSVVSLVQSSPVFGPMKQLEFTYSYKGKVQAAPPETLAFVVTLTYVNAGMFGDGKPPERPSMYFLADDVLRLELQPITVDRTLRRVGPGLADEVTIFYVVSMDDLVRISSSNKVAFRVGPWERVFKDKELKKLRAVVAKLSQVDRSDPEIKITQ